MWKLFFVIVCVLITSPVLAGELEEKQAQLQAIEWEFRYCNERMQNLNRMAQELQKEIREIQLSDKVKEEEEKEIDE